MTDRWRLYANLATLANAVLGVGAIVYVLAGNKLWAMLLIGCAVGFDGLDGLLSRRSSVAPRAFGRVADSVADAVTFGVAPAFLIAVHTADLDLWRPWETLAVAVAALFLAASVARLTYFTLRAFDRPHFLGVPTPQSALAVCVSVLFHDTPALVGVAPLGLLVGASVIAVMMVVPMRYPKIRRGHPLRWPMAATAVAAAFALVPLQFRPPPGSALETLALVASFALLVGVASYYVVGPFTVVRPRRMEDA